MLKILYAAGDNFNAKIQLSRFIKNTIGKPFQLKIAAYKKSSPLNASIDWTLDCLKFNNPNYTLNHDLFKTYLEQIKYYNPDLIISDLEYFTSYAATHLNINVWQCSSSIINYAFTKKQKYNLGLFKQYSFLFNKNPVYVQKIINIIDNSNKKLIYSHLGDSLSPPEIKDEYEWIRPYHQTGKISPTCEHNIVAISSLDSNKKILSLLRDIDDTVLFSPFLGEEYDNITIKTIEDESEYYCNLQNSSIFICEGQSSFLADAFYNKKFCMVVPNYHDHESIIQSVISEKLKLSKNISGVDDIEYQDISYQLNSKIYYLHEIIDRI